MEKKTVLYAQYAALLVTFPSGNRRQAFQNLGWPIGSFGFRTLKYKVIIIIIIIIIIIK